MSLSLLAATIKSASATVAQSANEMGRAVREIETLRQRMEKSRTDRKANELEALQEQPVFRLWLEVAAIDANHPELHKLETIIRTYLVVVKSSIFSDILTAFRRMQQQRRRGRPSGTPFRGALEADDVSAILSELTGR